MLSILRSLVQEVNSARDLNEALEIIVSRVQKAMSTEVCSVYLLDPASNRYILMATEGLYKDSVGKVSLAYSEGLVGLVGSREEPINLEDALPIRATATFLKPVRNDSVPSSVCPLSTTAGFLACWWCSSGKAPGALMKGKKHSWSPYQPNWQE